MVKNIVERIFSPTVQEVRNYRTKLALAQLESHSDPKLGLVSDALYESLSHTLTDEEHTLLTEIEQRRSFLLGLDQQIPVVSYGAGSPDAQKTPEEMANGVKTTSYISKVCTDSKSKVWATFLFKLIRKLKPSFCVELGSCVGLSASYQATALNLNRQGSLVTLEGSPAIAQIAQETVAGLGLTNVSVVTGPFHQTLDAVLRETQPIDFFFNDGHHSYDAVIQYFNQAFPYLSDNAVVVFDDISWSDGMKQAWTEIENDERVAVSVDLHTVGVAFIQKGPEKGAKATYKIPM